MEQENIWAWVVAAGSIISSATVLVFSFWIGRRTKRELKSSAEVSVPSGLNGYIDLRARSDNQLDWDRLERGDSSGKAIAAEIFEAGIKEMAEFNEFMPRKKVAA